MIGLLFVVAFVDTPTDPVVLPPRPAPVVAQAPTWAIPTSQLAPTNPTYNGVHVDGLQGESDAVKLDTGDGIASTGKVEVAKLAEVAERGETKDEYTARLLVDLCADLPWLGPCQGR